MEVSLAILMKVRIVVSCLQCVATLPAHNQQVAQDVQERFGWSLDVIWGEGVISRAAGTGRRASL